MWAIPTVGWTCQTSPHGTARIKRSGSLRTCSTSHAGQEEESIARSTASAIAVGRGSSSGVSKGQATKTVTRHARVDDNAL